MIATNDWMHTLAWSLLHFLWQGAAIAALAAACLFAFRKPATRYLIGIAALALMLVSFGVTFALLSGGSVDTTAVEGTASALAPPADYSVPVLSGEPAAAAATNGNAFIWIARGWLAGVFVLAVRIAFGLALLEYLRRRSLIALPAELVEKFGALQRRLGIRRAIRYCECQMLRVPAVIGIFRPIVLLPMRALTGLSAEQLEAVIAHELGHIQRFDVAVNFFQVIAETLFFFHPAVWWLNRRIRADREDCCDDVAVAACGGSVGYARALATMEGWRDVPSFAMAATGSSVAARVARLLGVRHADTTRDGAGVFTATVVLAAALIAGAVSLGVVKPASAQVAVPGQSDQIAQPPAPAQLPQPMPAADIPPPVAPPPPPAVEAAPPLPVAPPLPATPASDAKRADAAKPAKPARPARPAGPATPAPRSETSHVIDDTSFIEQMKSIGFEHLDVDELVALKVQGVTTDYMHEMQNVDVDTDVHVLVSMKTQDVTPEYVKEIRALGFKPESQEILAMKVQGITPEYVKSIRDLGLSPATGEIIAMKVHDVTPDYVRQIRAAGFNPDVKQLIAMKVHDITPEYRRTLEAAGYKLEVQQLIHAKVMDITPAFIEQANAHGFKNLSIEKLIHLKNADVF